MRRITLILVVLVFSLMIPVMAMAQARMPSSVPIQNVGKPTITVPDFSLTFRGQYSGDHLNQFAIFPTYKWSDHFATTMTIMFTDTIGEVTPIGLKVMGGGLWATGYGGLLYDTLLGHQVAWYPYLNGGYTGTWLEVASHNFFTASVRHHAERPNVAFNRLWIQVGTAPMHAKIGGMVEVTSPQDAEGNWLRSTTYVGPRVSFLTGPVRADIFYGLAVQDQTPDVDGDTRPFTRVWFGWTFSN